METKKDGVDKKEILEFGKVEIISDWHSFDGNMIRMGWKGNDMRAGDGFCRNSWVWLRGWTLKELAM